MLKPFSNTNQKKKTLFKLRNRFFSVLSSLVFLDFQVDLGGGGIPTSFPLSFPLFLFFYPLSASLEALIALWRSYLPLQRPYFNVADLSTPPPLQDDWPPSSSSLSVQINLLEVFFKKRFDFFFSESYPTSSQRFIPSAGQPPFHCASCWWICLIPLFSVFLFFPVSVSPVPTYRCFLLTFRIEEAQIGVGNYLSWLLISLVKI